MEKNTDTNGMDKYIDSLDVDEETKQAAKAMYAKSKKIPKWILDEREEMMNSSTVKCATVDYRLN